MEDHQIVDLYWARSESAIEETERKYGRYCYYIAHNILHNHEDSQECVNDTYWKAWGSMPQQRPSRLRTFLGKITRNLSLHKWERFHAKKRGGGQADLTLEELEECVPFEGSVEQIVDDLALTEVLNGFLGELSKDQRKIFLRRYFYFQSIGEIALAFGISESGVKMSLMRSRNRLKKKLEKEGIAL